MLQANAVADLLQCHVGSVKITKLPSAVQGSGVKNDVVMNMRPVRVRRDDECVFSFGKTKCEFPPPMHSRLPA